MIIRLTAVGLGLTCLGVGRTTLTREDAGRGKEPDNAYFLTNEPRVRGKEIDFRIDPPRRFFGGESAVQPLLKTLKDFLPAHVS